MRPFMRLLAVAALSLPALLLLPRTAQADPVGFAVGEGGPGFGPSARLYRLDLGSGAASLVGPVGYTDVEGLAFSRGGVLYAVADAGIACEGVCPGTTDLLLRIDTDTGAGTLVGPLGLAGQGPGGNLDYGLAFTCDGRLWASSDTTGQLWEVDPADGSTRPVANLGAPLSGLAAFGNLLFGIGVVGDLSLHRIDPDAGTTTVMGALGLPITFYDAGLDFDEDGRLWATIDYFNPPPPDDLPEAERNDIALVDPQTGAASITATISGAGSGLDTVRMEGLAIAAGAGCGVRAPANVPSGHPLAWLLLGALVLAAAGARVRIG